MEMPVPDNAAELDKILDRGGIKQRVREALGVSSILWLQCWPFAQLPRGITSSKIELKVVARFLRTNQPPPFGNGREEWQIAVFRAEERWPFGDALSPPLSSSQLAIIEQYAQKTKFN